MQTIRLASRFGGSAEIEPLHISISGRLAVHRKWLCDGRLSDYLFTITHVPTGWAIYNSGHIPLRRMDAPGLSEMIDLVMRLDGLDWNFQVVCQLPASTLAGMQAILAGVTAFWLGKDFKETCFSEPPQENKL